MALLALILVLGSAILVELQLMIDRWTDRRTDGKHDDSIYRARIASCGKNLNSVNLSRSIGFYD